MSADIPHLHFSHNNTYMKKPKIIFKRGVQTICFPILPPMGDFYFQAEAKKQIEKVKNIFKKEKMLNGLMK
jgi:hypothetical protein